MNILGIETTCDETGAAVVRDGKTIISNVVVSSFGFHKKYGGIVPEVAAREQIKSVIPVVKEALVRAFEGRSEKCESGNRDSHISPFISRIDAIAVAYGPGLIGSLLIGVETAKALALAWNKPLIAVNHLVGHMYANWLDSEKVSKVSKAKEQKALDAHGTLGTHDTPKFPLVALIASGAHTDLVLMTGHSRFRWLGGSLDDAAGEAFDKVARVLGLGYPGGPEIERAARNVKCQMSNVKCHFPRPMIDSKNFDFSFSGLKTAVINCVKRFSVRISEEEKSAIAFEFQNAVIEVLVTKTILASIKFGVRSIVVGGGVAANSELGYQMSDIGKKNKIKVFSPPAHLAVDNGAMIAAAGFFTKDYVDALDLCADPKLHF